MRLGNVCDHFYQYSIACDYWILFALGGRDQQASHGLDGDDRFGGLPL